MATMIMGTVAAPDKNGSMISLFFVVPFTGVTLNV